MDFQWMSKKANAGRFERGYLKVTTEKSYQLDFAQTRKAAEHQFLEVPLSCILFARLRGFRFRKPPGGITGR